MHHNQAYSNKGPYGFEAGNVRFHETSQLRAAHTPIPQRDGAPNESSQFLYQSNIIILGEKDDDPEDADFVQDVADENNVDGGVAHNFAARPAEAQSEILSHDVRIVKDARMVQGPKSQGKYSKLLVKNAANTGVTPKGSTLQQNSSIEMSAARLQGSNQKFQNMFVSSPRKAPWTPRAGTVDELSDQGQAGLQLRARPDSVNILAMQTPPNKLEQFLQTQELKRKQNGQLSESFQKNQWQFQRKTSSRMKRDPNQSHTSRQ